MTRTKAKSKRNSKTKNKSDLINYHYIMQTSSTWFEEVNKDNEYIFVIISKRIISWVEYFNSTAYNNETEMRLGEKRVDQQKEAYRIVKYKRF